MTKRLVLADDVTGEFDGVVDAQLKNTTAAIASGIAGGTRWLPVGDSLSTLAGGGASYMGWTIQAEIISDGTFTTVGNAAVVGDNAADVRARLAAILALTPNFVTLWVGTNDITQGRSLAAYSDDVTAIVSALQGAGCAVAIFTIPPRADLTKAGTISAWNAWLKGFARARGAHLIDAYGALVDPATGAFTSGFDYGDGIHIAAAGHNAVADEFVAVVTPRVSASDVIRPLTNVDPNNLIANGLLLSGSDAAPTSWVVTGGATTGFTEARVSDPAFRGGKAWEVSAVTPPSFRQFNQAPVGGWAVGDELLFTARVKVVSSSGVPAGSGLSLNCNFFGSSGVNPALQGLSLPGVEGVVSAVLTVPVGTTLVQLDAVFNPTAAGTVTYRVGDFGIFNLTEMGVA